MKRSSSWRSRVLSTDSDCADVSTWAEAEPVSPAPRLTSVMLLATSCGALRRLLHVAGDFLRRRALLLDRRGDGRGDLGDLADGRADLLDRRDRLLRRRLHAGDLRADLLGRLGGLAGQRLDLAARPPRSRGRPRRRAPPRWWR